MKEPRLIPENNLQLLRLLYNQLPQKYIAEQVGISQASYCKLEKQIIPISDEVIYKLNELFDIDVNQILFTPKTELWQRLLWDQPAQHFSLIQKIDMEIYDLRRRYKK
jgi:transcriptional regulator with XRE-family HTH domain